MLLALSVLRIGLRIEDARSWSRAETVLSVISDIHNTDNSDIEIFSIYQTPGGMQHDNTFVS